MRRRQKTFARSREGHPRRLSGHGARAHPGARGPGLGVEGGDEARPRSALDGGGRRRPEEGSASAGPGAVQARGPGRAQEDREQGPRSCSSPCSPRGSPWSRSEVPLEAAKLEAGSLAELTLAELLGAKPFHEFWNDAVRRPRASGGHLPEGGRGARQGEVGPRHREGSRPPVAARRARRLRPRAGRHLLRASARAASDRRDRARARSRSRLPNDVFIGLREVTHGEFFEWWKGLDRRGEEEAHSDGPDAIRARSCRSGRRIEGAPAPEVPEELRNKPVAASRSPPRRPTRRRAARAFRPSRNGARPPAGARDAPIRGATRGSPDQCNDVEHKVNDALPVGSMPGRGPFGHYDLAGNVAEWTATYESGKDVDPEQARERERRRPRRLVLPGEGRGLERLDLVSPRAVRPPERPGLQTRDGDKK